jgi:hypothetical protein
VRCKTPRHGSATTLMVCHRESVAAVWKVWKSFAGCAREEDNIGVKRSGLSEVLEVSFGSTLYSSCIVQHWQVTRGAESGVNGEARR